MRETWYLLEDGTPADPADVAPGDDGRLFHSDGRAVAYADTGGPRSTGVDPEEERAKTPAPKAKREMKPEAAKPYKTRA